MGDEPTKKETTALFKSLMKQGANKKCFDCPTLNPTWASIPHGVYVCLDCSGHHRNLGVHLSFIRSTDMDTWTWQQLRQMQVGGNAKAGAYFKKNGVNNEDIKSKYDSRIARTYRTKIESDGTKLHKKLGAALFDSTGGNDAVQDEKDFFEGELAKKATADSLTGTITPIKSTSGQADLSSSLFSKSDKPKPAKKLLVKKKGLGAKKAKKTGGLGAKKKAASNFDEIEKKAEAADAQRAKMTEMEQAEADANAKADAKQAKMSKFAVKTSKRDMSNMDDHKREQAERLGMGMGRQVNNANIFAHSTSATMQDVDQEDGDAEKGSFMDSSRNYRDTQPGGAGLDVDMYGLSMNDRDKDDGDSFFKSYGN